MNGSPSERVVGGTWAVRACIFNVPLVFIAQTTVFYIRLCPTFILKLSSCFPTPFSIKIYLCILVFIKKKKKGHLKVNAFFNHVFIDGLYVMILLECVINRFELFFGH